MKISARERKLLVAAGVAAAAVLVAVHVVEPFLRAQIVVRQQLEERQGLLARYERTAAEQEESQRQVAGLRARLRRAEAPLFRGAKPALAAAELQELLHRIAREAGVSIVRENVPPARVKGAFTEVAVELSLRGDLQAVRDFLFRLQTAPRLATVSKLVLRSYPAPGALTLTADAQVTGYLIADGDGE